MALTITRTGITSDLTTVEAHRGSTGKWTVTGRPGLRLTRNQAITAVSIAEELAGARPNLALVATLERELCD